MSQTASRKDFIAVEDRMMVAFELGWEKWRLAFATVMGEKPWQVVDSASRCAGSDEGDWEGGSGSGLAAGCRVFSCFEAGREGFWLDRQLTQMGVVNLVVDSSSIEVNRRARRAKTDRLDARKLVWMLLRYWAGEKDLWSVVRVPTAEQEDGRQLQREIRTLTKEQTRLTNRIKGLLASQGVAVRMGRGGLEEGLDAIRIWDGSPLPSGLRRRLEMEIARRDVVHRQLLDLESERDSRMRKGQDRASEIARRLKTLNGIGEAGAETYAREFSWREFKNRRQVGSLVGLTATPYQSGDSFAGARHQRSRQPPRPRRRDRPGLGLVASTARKQADAWFNSRFARGGPRLRKIGIVALARKLVIALWRYADFGEIPTGALLKPQA